MLLEIITPEKSLFKGEVELVQVPGTKGGFEILKNHAPIISTLTVGIVRIVLKGGEEKTFDINSGVLESHSNDIRILIEE